MPAPVCPSCGQIILPEDIHVAGDVAYCRACNLVHKLSALAGVAELQAAVAEPPAGTWRREEGGGVVMGASHRSLGTATGLLAMCLFWNGIVAVFVGFALSATLHLLHIPVPQWFPAPVMNDAPMGVGMTIFLWLFLTPFMVIGAAMAGAFLLALGGRTEVTIGAGEASIFTGIGSIGRRRRFDPQTVTDVRVEDRRWRDGDGDARRKTQIIIEMQNGKQMRCGTMLAEERMKFLAGALREAMVG